MLHFIVQFVCLSNSFSCNLLQIMIVFGNSTFLNSSQLTLLFGLPSSSTVTFNTSFAFGHFLRTEIQLILTIFSFIFVIDYIVTIIILCLRQLIEIAWHHFLGMFLIKLSSIISPATINNTSWRETPSSLTQRNVAVAEDYLGSISSFYSAEFIYGWQIVLRR